MQAFIEGTLSRDDYIRYLRTIAIVHAALEEKLMTASDPTVVAIWRNDMKRMPYLARDLEALAAWQVPDSRPATEEALGLVDRIQLLAAEQPVGLLGPLYVVEGSRNGASFVVKTIRTSLGIAEDTGLAFLSDAAAERDEEWADLSARMNQSLNSERQLDTVASAARSTLSYIVRMLESLCEPKRAELTWFATTLNSEAGRHPVPTDLREIEAVIRASRRCWEAFPYYALRYKARGIRFADSDCAWLATLEELPYENLLRQVNWLARLLSSRGMPSLLLEVQLRILFEELTRARPDRRQCHRSLLAAAEALAQARAAKLPDSAAASLADEFDTAVAAKGEGALSAMGRILIAAVCDEADGMDRAVTSILDWAAGSELTGPDWLRAADRTVDAARTAIKERRDVLY
jgi:heme oxygenase